MRRGIDPKSGSHGARFAETLQCERSRIVWHFARLTGNCDIAEDLAQETLIEAWRNQDNLRNPDQLRSWLYGIARNVYLRWRRSVGRESQRITRIVRDDSPLAAQEVRSDREHEDLEIELDRAQLAELLDRALDHLPLDTRSMLIEQFIEERSQQEIAERYGVSRGAVAMRVQRGKLLLRRVLVEQFPDEATAHGLITEQRASMTTNLWCRMCGTHRLVGTRDDGGGRFKLRCPACFPAYGVSELQVTGDVSGPAFPGEPFRSLYERTAGLSRSYLYQGLSNENVTCLHCGSPAFARVGLPQNLTTRERETHGVTVHCPNCGADASCSLSGLILSSPEGRSFRESHPRSRTLPEQYVERNGRQVIVSRFQPVHGARTLIALTDEQSLKTYELCWTSS